MLSEAHNLEPADAVERFRRRVEQLDRELEDLATALAEVHERGVPEAYWIAADFNRNQLTAERDWLAGVIQRIESKELVWLHRRKR